MSVAAPVHGGQEPLHVGIRNAFDRIRLHMEGEPRGWPALSPPDISGHVDCAVQYVDMSDSTRLAMEAGPERYAALVTAYCRETAAIVLQHGGYPIKYVGDAVMSIFTGYSLHAADAALGSAVSTMRMIHHAFVPATGVRVDVHVGMTYGGVVAVPQGLGVDILGAPANLASKLLALHRPVVMDSAFRERLHPESGDIVGLDCVWPYGGTVYEYVGGFHG